ncbi:MAG: AAA family ATPase [Pelagimonas sp.]|jgi:uncharacterized protein involved in exopolysaccharide biosynthesis/Mrp family chromosome partitioning ATPase|nr:AAA family ATPase [Pelagimonas sp.]
MTDRDQLMPTVNLGDALRTAFSALRRNWLILLQFLIVFVTLGVVYALLATPVYTARAALLIDPRIAQSPEGSELSPALLQSDGLTVDSEVHVLASREATNRTARALGLFDGPRDPYVPGLKDRVVNQLRNFLSGGPADPAGLAPEERTARDQESVRRDFVRGLEVSRSGSSYVIHVAYTSPDLQFAPKAVNTLIREYLALSSESRASRSQGMTDWLSSRIDELARGVRESENAVAEFRRENNLLEISGQKLPNEVELAAATEALIKYRGDLLSAEVQINQLREQIAAGDIEAVNLPDRQRTRALDEFEARYTDLLQNEQEVLLSRGADSPLALNIRQQKAQIRDLIITEYQQILERQETSYDALQRRVSATEELLAGLRERASEDARKSIVLRGLEREAEAKRQLYERLLEEFNATAQLPSFESNAARVIAWAVVPDRKSAPNSKLIVVLSVFAALVLGSSVVFLREALDNTFRRPDDLRDRLDLGYLGMVPTFRSDRSSAAPRTDKSKDLPRKTRTLRFAVDNPRSVTAETLRAAQIQLAWQDRQGDGRTGVPTDGKGRVLGFTSSLKDEGKTTTATNYAALLASQGEKVVLVDLDLVSCGLSRHTAPLLPPENQLSHALAGHALEAKPQEAFDGLTIIANSGAEPIHASNPRDAARLGDMLRKLGEKFDYVVVDLPPMQGLAEARALADLCDHLVLMLRWGATSEAEARTATAHLRKLKDRVAGVIYTRAPMRRFLSYNRHALKTYYYS